MKITYRRELKHNYMIIEPEQGTEGSGAEYVSRILSSNGIEGILQFQLRQMDGERWFYYEITSRQPLSRLLEGQCLQSGQIRSLVLGIAQTLERMEQYLLPESCVLLEPEYIYIEPEQFRVWLCLVPGLSGDFPEAYGKLLEYLLGKVDHQDKDSVVLAYGLYQETRKENYGIDDILRYLGKGGFSEKKEEKNGTDFQRRTEEKGQARAVESPGVWSEFPERISDEGICEKDCFRDRKGTAAQKNEGNSGKKGLWKKIRDWWKGRFSGEEEETAQIPWELMFEGEQEEEKREEDCQKEKIFQPDAASRPAVENAYYLQKEKEPPVSQDTVLLADFSPASTSGCRRLRCLDGENEDIAIAYYPFVIGKQINLVDYVLARDTVSRLHLRIDREENQYYARDLNSTNGTLIAGRLLEANERAPLKEGDEVSIAGYRYRFE